MPKISVVIPAYNGERYLKDAIESALKQSYAPFEVIVVDDGSTDSSADIARSYGKQVRLLQQPNGGVGAARANGIRSAGGDWIALLDQDDEFFQDKLWKQAQLIRKTSGLVVVYTGAIHKREDGTTRISPAFPSTKLWPALRYRSPILPSTAVIRRSAIVELGNFNPRLRMADDWDLWIRVVKRYSTIAFAAVPEPQSMYRIWAGNHSRQILKALAENESLVDAIVADTEGMNRWLWRRRLLSRFYHETAIELRENGNNQYFSFEFRSVRYWPFCGTVVPASRYKVFAVMLLQRLGWH